MVFALTQAEWNKIKKAGQIKEADETFRKKSIEKAIVECKRNLHATRTIRLRIQQLIASIDKTKRLLADVTNSEEYFYVGTDVDGAGEPDLSILARGDEAISEIESEMLQAQERFKEPLRYVPYHLRDLGDDVELERRDGTRRDIFDCDRWDPYADLAFDLLMTQAATRGAAPPISSKELAVNPRFVEFVYLCAKAANRELIADYPRQRNTLVDRAIDNAAIMFRMMKKESPEDWRWNWE